MMRRVSLALAAACGLAVPAAAQQAALAGHWTFDATRSVGDYLPTAANMVVAQHGDTLIMDRTSISAAVGEQKTHIVEATDGQPWKNTITVAGQDVELTSTLSWSHDTLVVKSSASVQGSDFVDVDHIVVSPDGKTLTYIREINVAGQDLPPQTMVFTKQD